MANNTLEYIFSLEDKMSDTLKGIVSSTDEVKGMLGAMQEKSKSVDRLFASLGTTTGTLKSKLDMLKRERELIPASNISAIKTYNREINNLSGEIDRLESNSGKLKGALSSLPFGNILTNPIVLATAAIYKFWQVVKGGLDAWGAQQEAETKLAAVMRNTMGARKEDVQSIIELTAAQQKLGVIGDEVQLAGAQELSTYLSRRDSMEKLLPVMNDMLAQQYGMNASQEQAANIASMMGKVMDGQVGALSRYGYKFTEAQEKILKYGKETERAAVLSDVIGQSEGGVNKALANTPEGKWKQHQNAMGDLRESVGRLAVAFRSSLFPIFEKCGELFEGMVGWFDKHRDTISGFFDAIATTSGWILTAVGDTIGAIITPFKWLLGNLPAIIPILSGVAIAIGLANKAAIAKVIATKAMVVWEGICTAATSGLAIATGALNAVLAVSPLGWVAFAVGAVVGAITLCWNKFEGFRKVVLGTLEVVKKFGTTLWESIIDPFKKILSGLGSIGKAIAELFKGNFKEAWQSAKEGAKSFGSGLIESNPITVAVNTGKKIVEEKDGYAAAWEAGKQKGAESWAASQEKKNKTAAAVDTAGLTIASDDPFGIKPEKGGKSGGSKTLNLNDLSDGVNLNASGAYSEIMSKLAPRAIKLSPIVEAKNILPLQAELPGMAQSSATTIDEKRQEYGAKRENFIEDIMLNVRKIAAVAAIPLALALPVPSSSQATAMPDFSEAKNAGAGVSPAQNRNNRPVADRICDQIVINVANTDGRGREEIKENIYSVLREITEG